MIKIDLITGFLGSGKTTFLLKYADYLMRQGLKIGILEYDHGAINVDFLLLQKLRGEQCELEMLSAACDADCHKRRFKTKLISMAMTGYDRIIIEPSGVFDVDEFLDNINEPPLDRWCEPGSIITVVDSGIGDMAISHASENMLVSQIANAGLVLFSKTQNYNEGTILKTTEYIKAALKNAGCSKKVDAVSEFRNWSEFADSDFQAFSKCGYRLTDYIKYGFGEQDNFETVCFMNEQLSLEAINNAADVLFSSNRFGNIIRIKGFVCEKQQWYSVNIERNNKRIEPISAGKDALIVIGEQLDEDGIRKLITNVKSC